MKILIVEDEKALILVLQEKLAKLGFDVKIVSNGEDALSGMKKDKFDLVLLDLLLPKKNGFEVLEEMKSDPELTNVPVIVLSNLGEDEDIKRAVSLGVRDYFVKAQHPINEVVDKVKKFSVEGK